MRKILVTGHDPKNPMGLFAEILEVFNQLIRSKQLTGQYDTELAVEWGSECCYYHAGTGNNVFEYYFTPLFDKPLVPGEERLLGNKIAGFYDEEKVSKCTWGPLSVHRNEKSKDKFVKQANKEIWQKIFRFRPEVEHKLETATRNLMQDYVFVGTHRRTTDWGHGPIPNRLDVFNALDDYVADGYSVYLSTDNDYEVQEFKTKYGDALFYNQVCRGTNAHGQPMFGHCESPAQHGYEAILDAYMLAKADVRLATSSNLSTFAAILNPWQTLDERLQPTVHGIEWENGKYAAVHSQKYPGWPNTRGWGA